MGQANGRNPSFVALNTFTLLAVPALYKWAMTVTMLTCRVHSSGMQPIRELARQGKPWLYCSWHSNTAMAVYQLRNRGVAMMASASRDGELIARAIERLGNVPIRGSTSVRGGQAARDMVRAVKRGACGGITPDGPRGPAHRCQAGALWVAALTGCPLVPYELDASRRWRINSWDRHKMPKPFSTVYEYFGEPLYVTRRTLRDSGAGLLDDLERRMLDNTRACLRAAGHGDEAPMVSGE